MQFIENSIPRASSFGSNETEVSVPPQFSFVLLALFLLQNKQTKQEVNIFIFDYCSSHDSVPATSGK